MKGTVHHSDAGRGDGGHFLGLLAFVERAPATRKISRILTRGGVAEVSMQFRGCQGGIGGVDDEQTGKWRRYSL